MNYRTLSTRSGVTDLTGGNSASGGSTSAIKPSGDGNTTAPSQVTSLVPQTTSSGPGNMASIGPSAPDAARSGQASLGPVQVAGHARTSSQSTSLDKPSIQAALPVSSGRRDSVSRAPLGSPAFVEAALAQGLRSPPVPTVFARRPAFQVQAESARYVPDQPPAVSPWVPLGIGFVALLAVGYALTR